MVMVGEGTWLMLYVYEGLQKVEIGGCMRWYLSVCVIYLAPHVNIGSNQF